MNVFCIIIGILIAIAAIVLAVVRQVRENNDAYRECRETKKTKKAAWVALALVGIMIFTLGCSFEIIPTGETGVRTTFGQIDQTTIPNGFVWKIPFVQSIHTVNNKLQDKTFESEIWGETVDKTPVYASNVVVSYQISTSRSAWIFANVSDTNELLTQDIIASAIKSAMVEMDVNDVTNRAKIEPLAKEKLAASLNEKYGEGTILITKVTINQMDFEDVYNQAIQQKSLALQEQERQAIANQTAIEKAEADKAVAITNAEAQAEAKRIAAEADAEATRIAAEAEAEANTKIRESLSDAVLQSKFYDVWDGELPDAMGVDTVITDITGNSGSSNPTP